MILIFYILVLLNPQMQLFPGMWFSHTGQLVSVDLVVKPSPVSSLARIQILRPYCNPNHHLVPPGTVKLFLWRFSKSAFLLDNIENHLYFAYKVAAFSSIHSAAVQKSLCVTPQGVAAWANTGATWRRPVCPPPLPVAPMMLPQGPMAMFYLPDTLQCHPSTM